MLKIPCVIGPTASGKTELGLKLATKLPIEIISVDSAMIYRGMDIGSAKPTLDEQAMCPHHLIDILNPDETYSASRFLKDVSVLVDAIIQRGNLPLLLGGTMMYFHVLQAGLSSLPESNESIRNEIKAFAEKKGWGAVHQKLSEIDRTAAERIKPTDTQRLARAWEVYLLTGEPLTELQSRTSERLPYEFMNCVLFPSDRTWLHQRIEKRFKQMIHQGLIAEVETILAQFPQSKTGPAMRSVGYRQIIDYLDGKWDYSECLNRGMIATRQLAKRQCTWLRSWPFEKHVFDPQASNLFTEVCRYFDDL